MNWSSAQKLLQKQTYDLLSHRYGTIIVICGIIMVFVSALQFGEVAMEWSHEKYAAVFNSFSDNVAGKSYRERLCLPVPIDVVYTWVNGSDPKLLTQLLKYRTEVELELNETGMAKCVFTHCVPSTSVILDPPIPSEIRMANLAILYPALRAATQVFTLKSPTDDKMNVTVVAFDTQEQVDMVLKERVVVHGKNVSIRHAFYTSDWTLPNSVLLHDVMVIAGFPHTYTSQRLKQAIPKKYHQSISKVVIYEDRGVGLIFMPDKKEDFESLLQEKNFTIEGKKQTLNAANLIWDLRDYSHSEDISASRFEDNEELRYSLRSIEKYAPWVRHVYVVSNGQIPSWLNLDAPRITLVTHEELFLNKSHLPTFSSPAIESHLHRIPGLSDKFIYLNDDVMFGKEVWPDDFYTHAHGEKIYLTWPVPNCQDGCPSTWIRDGYCDKACNNSECEWDGGDCEGGGRQAFGGGMPGNNWEHVADVDYCNAGCANNWIADKYCDQACNLKACGFDAGDCGVQDFHKLQEVKVVPNVTEYTLRQGETIAYMNLTTFVGRNATLEEGAYEFNDAIRSMSLAQKFNVITIVLYPNRNATKLHIWVEQKIGKDSKKELNLTLSVATRSAAQNQTAISIRHGDLLLTANRTLLNTTKSHKFVFSEIPPEKRFPKRLSDWERSIPRRDVNMTEYALPDDISLELQQLIQDLIQGDLTEKGFKLRQSALWDSYSATLYAEGKKPIKHKNKTEESRSVIGTLEINKQLPLKNSDIKDVAFSRSEKTKNKDKEFSLGNYLHQKSRQNNTTREDLKQLNSTLERAGNSQEIAGQSVDRNQRVVMKENPVSVKNVSMRGNVKKTHQTYTVKSHKTRKLNSLTDIKGFLPWEKQGFFTNIEKRKMALQRKQTYETLSVRGRKLLDTFADSLRHVNKVYNKAFGFVPRKVPAHMPHMIDKHIMAELQARFPEEWDSTSAHRIRSSYDMQFAFSYYYYVMGEKRNISVAGVFDDMDTDHSGVLSDREIRTLTTRLYELPLDLQTLTRVEAMFINCSKTTPRDPTNHIYQREVYYDSNMTQVTKHLVTNCKPICDLIMSKFSSQPKYKFETVEDGDVAFKMIQSNISNVVGQLDDIRKTPKKFICLNDNIDHSKEDAKTVKAVLQDFYESLFPVPSSFELPREYRNRFLHMDELREWRKYRDWLKLWTQVALVFLIIFTVGSFFSDKIEAIKRKLFGRRYQAGSQSKDHKRSGSPSPSNRQSVILDV